MYLMVVLFCSGCGLRAREEAVQKKEDELAQREQQLSLREKSLALREEEVLELKQKLDSVKTKTDTALVYNQQLIGEWNVKMTCTETTCPGSAVGDTKTETWNIGYDSSFIVAKAIASDKLVRVYTGSYDGNMLTLTENITDAPTEPATKMTIRLTLTGNDTMEGQREIVRENDCRIIYSLQLSKQKSSSK
jgi:hypothetical protein